MENKKIPAYIAVLYILCVINIIASIVIMTFVIDKPEDHICDASCATQECPYEPTYEMVEIEDITTETSMTLVEIEDITTEPTEESMIETTVEPTKETSKEPTTEPIKETKPAIDEDLLEMLACVIYQEAGGDHQCDMCRCRVADIVLNRVADSRFPNTVYDVLTEKNQYGSFHWTGIVWPSRATNPYEKHAVERAYRIAREVLSGQHSDLYGKGYIWQATFVQGTDNVYCCGHYYGR